MDASYPTLLSILLVGGVSMAPIMTLPTFRTGWRCLRTNPVLGVPLLSMYALLFWPIDPGQAFSSASELGAMRLARVAVMGALFLWLAPHFLRAPIFLRRSILNLYLLYILACAVSAIYAPNWQEAIWKSFELVVVLTFASVLRNEVRREQLDLRQIIAVFTLLSFIIVLFALVGGALHPGLAYGQWTYAEAKSTSQSMGGILPRVNPNSLGQFSAMILFAGVVPWVLSSRVNTERMLMILVGSAGLLLAHSRTSIAAVALVLIVFLLLSRRLSGLVLVFSLAAAGLSAVGAFIDYLLRGQELELFYSLSGRTWMWNIAWESIQANPWLGLGYAGHKTLDVALGMEYSSLDSTYLEALVNVGIVGSMFLFVFVSVVVYRFAIRFVRASRSALDDAIWVTVAAGFIWIMLVRSVAGPSFQVFHWNLIMLLAIAASAIDSHGSGSRVTPAGATARGNGR